MRQYVVDAFTDKLFSGNQAAVCVLERWIPDELMQNIAKENNLSETAFTVKEGDVYHLRWFTPGGEIDFCGHATLGTSFVLFNYYCREQEEIIFRGQIGQIRVARKGDSYEMEFPAYRLHPVEVTEEMTDALGERPLEAYLDRDLLMVMENEMVVKNLKPDQEKLKLLKGLCIGVTARGTEYDCVSRVFAPELDIPEDPVTGSTHCMIVPLWAGKLGKDEIVAYQASARTGTLYAKMEGERVRIAGKAVLYSVADILPEYSAGLS